MNVLITGANGYIGKSIVKSLANDYNVLSVENSLKYKVKKNIFCMNLLDERDVNLFLEEDISIDIIIHIASKMASTDNINDMNILYDNIKMYEHIVKITQHFNPQKLINFSSIAVYPNIDGEYDEYSIVKPSVNGDALYGLSKFCGENILDFMLKKSNTSIINMRVGQVFSDDLRDDRLYRIMKKELMTTNTVTVFGNGERVSNFIHKDVLIKKVLFLIEQDYSGVFNIGDENLSYKEYASNIISLFGNKESQILFNENGLKSKCYINLDKFNSLESKNV